MRFQKLEPLKNSKTNHVMPRSVNFSKIFLKSSSWDSPFMLSFLTGTQLWKKLYSACRGDMIEGHVRVVSQIHINYCWYLIIWSFVKSKYPRIVLSQVTLIIMFLHIIIINNLLYKLLCCFCRKINILLFILLIIHHEC